MLLILTLAVVCGGLYLYLFREKKEEAALRDQLKHLTDTPVGFSIEDTVPVPAKRTVAAAPRDPNTLLVKTVVEAKTPSPAKKAKASTAKLNQAKSRYGDDDYDDSNYYAPTRSYSDYTPSVPSYDSGSSSSSSSDYGSSSSSCDSSSSSDSSGGGSCSSD